MARIGFSGFAANDPSTGGNLDGLWTATRESIIIRNGRFSAKCDSGAGNSAVGCRHPDSSIVSGAGVTRICYARAYFYFNSLPGVTTAIMCPAYKNGSTNLDCILKVDSTGHLIARIQNSSDSSPSVVALSIQTWYRIEMKCTFSINAGNTQISASIDDVLLDGVSTGISRGAIADSSAPITATFGGIGSGAFLLVWGWLTAPGANTVCYVSDIAINDDQGANQNSYPGSGKCVLLLPISNNNTSDAKWTDNSGTQVNMWQGVANTPPKGIATAQTPAYSYIKNAGGEAGTTGSYYANMATYSSVGIAAGDTINCIYFVEVDGEESGTGSKLLNFEVISNPVMASPGNVTAGNDAGAQGTYATNWATHKSAMTYNPSVTVGVSPVMRARRPETATRVASVCFMGMYVDYTPSSASPKRMRAAVFGA